MTTGDERSLARAEVHLPKSGVRDHLYYIESCGFDAFELDGEDAAAALSAFGDFSEAYQASVARPLPLFRRRAPRAASQSK